MAKSHRIVLYYKHSRNNATFGTKWERNAKRTKPWHYSNGFYAIKIMSKNQNFKNSLWKQLQGNKVLIEIQ